mgnify:CR=1 FL=1
MRQLVLTKPKNGFRINRLATGYAVVSLYAGYIETPVSGRTMLTANIVDVKVADSPDLEMDVLRRWPWYYKKALENEVQYLREQYKKTVDELLATLPPGKKSAVVDKAEEIIRKIAYGDQHYLIRQDLLKILKQNI